MWDIAGFLGITPDVATRIYAKHSPEHLRRAASAIRRVGDRMAEDPAIRVKKARARGETFPTGEAEKRKSRNENRGRS